jgi:hypothetical protein
LLRKQRITNEGAFSGEELMGLLAIRDSIYLLCTCTTNICGRGLGLLLLTKLKWRHLSIVDKEIIYLRNSGASWSLPMQSEALILGISVMS